MHVASKILEQTTSTNTLFEKKRNSASVEVSPPNNLMITKQRFALNSADAIEISYNPKRLEIRLQTPNNRSLFKLLSERSEKFASPKI